MQKGHPRGIAQILIEGSPYVVFHACLTLEIPSYDAADCPHCEAGEPLTIT